jgi:hypothetical protein
MKKTKLFHPYLTDKTKNKTARATLKLTGAGVYYITEKIGGVFKLVYIGYSGTDVKKTMYRHFQKWIDKRHPENKRVQRIERVSYFDKDFKNTDFKCKVIFCKNATEALNLESALIGKLKPRDNNAKLGFDEEVQFYLKKYKEADEIPAAQSFDDLPF